VVGAAYRDQARSAVNALSKHPRSAAREWRLQSLRAVDIASMVDTVYVDDALVLLHPVDDAIRADSCAVPPFEFPSERVPDSVRVGDQTSKAELDDCAHDPRRGRRQAIELASSRW
jgi:hypothetical protein